ncbi:MAG: hypothetical protein MUF24_08230 [Chitinophagaceae bacterium]|nr:hypothetical protein [Chitinophagaceae bacterium]
MSATLLDNSTSSLPSKKYPSLLRQIVDRVDEMDEGSKKLLLLTLMRGELSEKYKTLDKVIAEGEILSEAEIDMIVSETRQNLYEQKVRP